MTAEATLFDMRRPPLSGRIEAGAHPAPITARAPSVNAEERPRLSRQCVAILARLYRGTATAKELAEIALNYRARISDLRAAGYCVRCVARDTRTGRTEYALLIDPMKGCVE